MHRVGLSKFSCEVVGCNFKSKRKDNLLQHIRKEHSSYCTKSDGESQSLEVPPPLASDGNDATPDRIIANDTSLLRIEDAFMEAASTGNVSLLNYMLERGIGIEMRAEDGCTALHCASRTGQVAMIKNLLEKGATVDPRNSKMKDKRPIHEAVFGKSAEGVAVLLSAGADIMTLDHDGRTVIDYVGLTGDIPIAQTLFQGEHWQLCTSEMASKLVVATVKAGKSLLLEWLLSKFPQAIPHPDNVRKSPIYIATSRGNHKVLEILLLYVELPSNSNPNFVKAISLSLPKATTRNDLATVKILIGCDALKVNQKNYWGITALDIAVREGHTNIVKLLLSHHDVNLMLENEYGRTPFHSAAIEGHVDILTLLLNHCGVDSQRKDQNGQTALELALLNCKLEAVRLIANHVRAAIGLDFEFIEGETLSITSDTVLSLVIFLLQRGLLTKNTKKWSNFIYGIVQSGATKLVKLLLDQSWFDVNEWTGVFAESTALHMAAQLHRHEILSLLLDHPRINLNKQKYEWLGHGDTVLHSAVQYGNTTAVKLLLARPQMNLALYGDAGHTALGLARKLERHEIVELLLQCGAKETPHG
jgi:ankyrin repeat protein